jgi:hypothetical protein
MQGSAILRASSGLVANPASSPIPAARHRSRSSVCFSGRYSSRPVRARPPSGVTYAANTPTWQFSTRPAVPVYMRATPADIRPFVRKPVSSTASTAAGSPIARTT